MRRVVANRRQKELPLVLNKVVGLDENAALSTDNLPVAIVERNDSTYSSNKGTNRPLQNGWAIVGNGSVSIAVTGLLATDTVEYPHGGDSVTLATDAINIPLDNEVIAFNILRGGSLWASFNLESRSQNYLLDNSGFDRHGLIVNYYAGLWVESNEYSALDELGYTLSDGVTYYLNDDATGLIEANVFIPKLQGSANKCVAYLVNGERANLQNKGKAPSRGRFVDTICFQGNSDAYFTFPAIQNVQYFRFTCYVSLQNTSAQTLLGGESSSAIFIFYDNNTNICTIRVSNGGSFIVADLTFSPYFVGDLIKLKVEIYSGVARLYINDVLRDTQIPTIYSLSWGAIAARGLGDFKLLNGSITYDLILELLNSSGSYISTPGFWTLSGYIQDPSNHIEFDISGDDRHATLINGSTANRGEFIRPEGDYSQLGYTVSDGANYYYDQLLISLIPIGVKIPALASDLTKCVAYTTGGVRAALGIQQDGESFLDTGTKIQATATPRVSQAEKIIRKWTDANGDYITLSHADFTGAETGDQDFNDVSETDIVKDMRKHHISLEGRQLITEKVITKN